jgi:hypothetical protein
MIIQFEPETSMQVDNYNSIAHGGVGVLGFSQSTGKDLLLKQEYQGLSSHRGLSFFYCVFR